GTGLRCVGLGPLVPLLSLSDSNCANRRSSASICRDMALTSSDWSFISVEDPGEAFLANTEPKIKRMTTETAATAIHI
ncbi:MAG: hypothetical protein M1459_02640, partial [Patescibacteria group bacterium]|nr:hypothetical protein [Patescibacteria group bacterium]